MDHHDDAPMPVSTFRDESAREWQVREIREMLVQHRPGLLARPEYSDGWLLFTSGEERRRLAPLPPGWRVASETQLRRWCADAAPVKPA